MKKTTLTLAAGAASLIFIGSASAALLIPVGIETFHQGDSLSGNGSNLRVIDGSGMTKPDANDPSTWTVSSTRWQDDWQGFQAPIAPANVNTWAVLDLGAAQPLLDRMYLWNTIEGGAGLNRGMQDFELYYIAGGVAPADAVPATTGGVITYDFNSGTSNWTQLGGTYTLAKGTQIGDPGQNWDVSGAAGTQYIGIRMLTNYGGNRTGFGEIAFTVPEPSGVMVLAGFGFAGLLLRRRRR